MSRYKWVILALAGILLVARVGAAVMQMTTGVVPASVRVNALPMIIIDPGHGGVDGGAVGSEDIVEKDINLEVSLVLRDLMLMSGFDVVMTRETDISIHDEGITGIKKQKTSDLRNRLAMMQEYPDAIFISIHQNKFGDTRSNGTQVFFSPNNSGSEELAKILQSRVVALIQPGNKRLQKKAGKNLYLMTQAKCPAILMECGFLSNPEEARLLTGKEYQSKLAFVAFQSVLEYLSPESMGENSPPAPAA